MDLGPWTLPLGVLAFGGMIAFFMSRSLVDSSGASDEPSGGLGDQLELEAKKESLLMELKELEESRSTLEEDIYQKRRSDLISEGSMIVKALSKESGSGSSRNPGGLWLIMSLILAFLLFVIVFAKEAAQPRMDGEGMTGGGAAGQTMTSQQVDQRVAVVQAEVEAALATLDVAPENLDALNFLTHQAIMSGELASAMQWSTTAREVAPSDPEVIVHSAALAMRVGMQELALERLMAVLEEDPAHLEARWWMAVAVANSGDLLASKEAVAPLLAVSGEYGQLANLLTIDLDIALANQAPTSEPSVQGGLVEEESLSEEVTSDVVPIVISLLEPELYTGGGTLFVAAVRSSSGGGPPLAARRIDNPVFEMEITLGPSDSIFPGDWPEEFWLRARIDFDGDPAIDSAGEFVSELWGPVSIGEPVDLVLNPVQ